MVMVIRLQFNWKYKDYELRAIPRGLIRTNPKEENYTIELLKWSEDTCYTLLYWKCNRDGYEVKFVHDRPFTNIGDKDLLIIWEQMIKAQEVLDNFELKCTFEEYL